MRRDINEKLGIILGMIFIGLLLGSVSGLIFLWSCNTLFNLSIAYTLKNWFAAVLLMAIFTTRTSSK